MSLIRYALIPVLLAGSVICQHIQINEVMSSNFDTISDEDGDFPDWIELHNCEPDAVSLDGWGISDDPDDPFKWVFPAVTLQPNDYLIVFASNKDRDEWINHWETVITWGDSWNYFVGTSEPPFNWNAVGFDDQSWQTGPSGFGYGDGDDATTVENTISVYVRHAFPAGPLDNILQAILHVDYDDAFVAYLNGWEIGRANIGAPGVPPPYDQGSDNYYHEAQIYQGGYPEAFPVDDVEGILQEDGNVLAIQVHNHSLTSSDLTLIPFFTFGMENPPNDPQGTHELIQQNVARLHTNFRISSDGEPLVLTRVDGTRADSLTVPHLTSDLSLGRNPEDEDQWLLYPDATPGEINSGTGYQDFAPNPLFSHDGGFYNAPFQLTLSTESGGDVIVYTTDGEDPDQTSSVYTGPVNITQSTVIRARALVAGAYSHHPVTKTYIFEQDISLPVMALTTSPGNLWDPDSGIYVLGDDYEPWDPYYGANFWEDWERPVHVEFYEPGGSPGFQLDAGMKIFGGWSRARPQKPLAVFARSRYGTNEINYPLFTNRSQDSFESFLLRNSANDWDRTYFADGLMQDLVEPLDLETQAFRPCVVYINGEYWGIQNIREKQNEHYLAAHHDIDPDNIDMLEGDGSPIHGDEEHYNMMLETIASADMSLPESFQTVTEMMEIDNFITYFGSNIYFDNRDWPGNNIKYWRPRTDDGRWRWLMYDTDWGFGINAYGAGGNQYGYQYNTLAFCLSPTQTYNHHGNPPWSTFLFRSLSENPIFRQDFTNQYLDMINTVFINETVQNDIDSLQNLIESEMPRHYQRWHDEGLWWGSLSEWYNYIDIMRGFGQMRPAYARSHLRSEFEYGPEVQLQFDIDPPGSGKLLLNTIELTEFPWSGYYIPEVPVTVTAAAGEGYQFTEWTGIEGDSETLTFQPFSGSVITARFEEAAVPDVNVILNEINYHSADEFDTGDWLELMNFGQDPADVSGWQLRDEDAAVPLYLPAGTVIQPMDYLVVCRDSAAFNELYPTVETVSGSLPFGLSNGGELIWLLDAGSELVDSVRYNDELPWPEEADGEGATLELLDAGSDNGVAENWFASDGTGTPGTDNSIIWLFCSHSGDADGDGTVTVTDIVMTVAFILDQTAFSPSVACETDINNDSYTDILDIILMVDIILNP